MKSKERFVHEGLALSPVGAAGTGYHRHVDARTGRTLALDEMLDDFSPQGIERQREVTRGLRRELARFDPVRLDAAERIDFAIMRNALDESDFDLDRVQAHRHNPTKYVNLLGYGIFQPMVQEYAPLEVRVKHIFARLEQIPVFLGTARANLGSTQLPTYFVGFVEWQSIREAAERAEGAKFNLKAFHDRALAAGPIPMSELRKWMLSPEAQGESKKAPAAHPAAWRSGGIARFDRRRCRGGTNVGVGLSRVWPRCGSFTARLPILRRVGGRATRREYS